MPVARYFLFVGGALLALLLVVSALSPQMPVAETANTAADLPAIRIHSDRKWPEKVVFDTNAATIVPIQTANTDAAMAAPVKVAETAPKETARDAFAQAAASDLKTASLKKTASKPQKRKIARRRVGPPAIMVAQQPPFGFGFFGNRIW
ncbi:hypothetical protein [Bradyrhizobium sp. dw_78]|uniref:hypothetical protein n=1 Tax=Bradyrhizobium sp. dw_78 TaxID=2719793 RepID=UPI001BD6CB95|nr:hypothetical protein [Bradyrhizobium sp. dw_78]